MSKFEWRGVFERSGVEKLIWFEKEKLFKCIEWSDRVLRLIELIYRMERNKHNHDDKQRACGCTSFQFYFPIGFFIISLIFFIVEFYLISISFETKFGALIV